MTYPNSFVNEVFPLWNSDHNRPMGRRTNDYRTFVTTINNLHTLVSRKLQRAYQSDSFSFPAPQTLFLFADMLEIPYCHHKLHLGVNLNIEPLQIYHLFIIMYCHLGWGLIRCARNASTFSTLINLHFLNCVSIDYISMMQVLKKLLYRELK